MNNQRLFFILIAVCTAIGLGNLWLYPYFSFKYTGLIFIPYFIAILLVGIPVLILELSIGQYFDKNVVDIFYSVRKWFSSIGWLISFNAFIVMCYFAVMLSWNIIYFFASFGTQWKNNASHYFFNNVLQASGNLSGFGGLSLPVFIALLISWLLIFVYVGKGYKSIKRSFFVTSMVLAVLLIFFLFYSLLLGNALNGIYAFIKPDFGALFNPEVWLASFSMALLSLGASFGIMTALGTKMKKGLVVGNSFAISTFELVISVAMGFIMFSILGFLSLKNGVAVEALVSSNYSSTFTVLANAFPLLPKSSVISLLFFVFLILFFILGTSSLAYAISHVLVHKFNTKHINVSILVCGLGFLGGLVFATKPGIYLMDIVSHFSSYNILLVILLECIAIGWFFDSEKMASFINSNSKIKIGVVWRFLIRFIVPLVVIFFIILQLKSDLMSSYNNYPLWVLLSFGLGTVAVPIVAAFLMPEKIFDRR